MRVPLLVIDIGEDIVMAGLFSRKRLELIRSIAIPFKGDLKVAISTILKEFGNKNLSWSVVGLPYSSVAVRIMTLPFTDTKRLEEVLPFEAGDIFLKGSKELVLGGVSLADGNVLVVSIERGILRNYLDILKESGIDPSWVSLSLFSRDRLLKKLYDGSDTAAFLDAESLVVSKGGRACFFKGIKDGMDLRLTLALLEGDGNEIERFYATDKGMKYLDALGKNPISIKEPWHDMAGLFAMACHFKEGFKGGINFRKGEFAGTKERESVRNWSKTAAALLVLLMVLWGWYSYIRYETMSEDLKRMKTNLEHDYHALLPEDARVIDPLYQLEVKLKELKGTTGVMKGGVNVLDIMRGFSEAGERVRFNQFEIEGERVAAKGETDSFEEANNFKESLQRLPYFKDIILIDAKAKARGVGFGITGLIKR